ncbi:MAG: hypothetical protein WBD20_14710 [Pirellulaceae bacterium]
MTDHSEQSTYRISPAQLSLRELLLVIAVVALAAGYFLSARRLQTAETELEKLRTEFGYLEPSEPNQVAAVRVPSDQPLTYRFRVRVPKTNRYRVTYSSIWEQGESGPTWFAAAPVAAGESLIIVRVMKDPRDDLWKITAIVQSDSGTIRVGSVLPEEHSRVFRRSADAISAGIDRKTVAVSKDKSLRLLDEKWLVGEGSLMLYCNRPPEQDQIGIFAELQPDVGTL